MERGRKIMTVVYDVHEERKRKMGCGREDKTLMFLVDESRNRC